MAMSFGDAVAKVKHLFAKPTDDELLEIYGLYKQATVGDNNSAKPGMFDFKGKAKWNAWKKHEGTPEDDAKHLYVQAVEQLIEKYGCGL